MYPRVTGEMPKKLMKEYCLQQTRLQYVTTKICSILYKMRASLPDGQQAWMFTIFHTQVLGLRMNILVNVAVYPAILSCSRLQIDEKIANRRRKMMLWQQY